MTKTQQQYVNTITESFYAKGAEEQHAEYRELASRVYANALRNPDTSLLELKLIFEPLQTIATSAGFTENAAAVGRAITQPFADGAVALQGSQAFAKIAATAIKLADDPLANIKGAWNGVQATTEAASQLAQHATGVLTTEERQRLAAIYDLPYVQRIQALHGVTLKDTAAMVSIGSLPGLLPNAMTKTKVIINGTGAAIAQEVENLPVLHGSYPLPVLVGGDYSVDSSLPNLPQVLSMASKDTDVGGGTAGNVKKLKIEDYEFPDPNYDHERSYYNLYREHHVKTLSEHMTALGLKEETGLMQKQLDHMLDVRVTTNTSEYNIVLNKAQRFVTQAESTAYTKSIATGSSVDEAGEASHSITRQFNLIQRYVQYERNKSFIDLTKVQNKYELQEQARVDPDSVGYGRTVSPRSTTERELHHHLYLQDLRDKILELKDKLEILGLKDRAESLGDRMREMLAVSLEGSKATHNQRLADFMKIEAEAKSADIKNSSATYISEGQFKKIQEGIGADLEHLKEEIGHDREYHVRDQLFRRQSGDERRASESVEIERARDELFGDNQTIVTQEPDPEPER